MDPLQEQVSNLSTKVDALHGSLEQVGSQIIDILSELKGKERGYSSSSGASLGRYSPPSRSSFDMEMAHKDVLADDNYSDSDSQKGDRVLAPEVQIQRLTAQLTAAYNRIAALEEQLMSRRVL
ncbi:MAG: hypothetical protein KME15_21545 [Drouetiella hepatica Uher 2000/2452]|jgi:hypothetical protein|uniref:Uncharacterized protein n=1 Tax=Drouetiella hepatica Uher 2000/2452 TaxID=904376 RepID=A0A951UP88_9CYAN|nr:hypothetical protein [Drouetiella hepatica Uher 2000/2452]